MEIDLTELLHRICRQWKQVLACALTGALILSGCGFLKGKSAADAAEMAVEGNMELTKEEQKGVTDAVELENDIRKLQEYMDNSILMNIDPYHRNKAVMLYCIDRTERQNLQKITESYLSFVINGGAADALKKSGSSVWDIDKNYLDEVISAYQKTYSSPYQVVVDDSADSGPLSESLFYVEITGRDAESAQKMAQDMKSVLKRYSAQAADAAGSHRLTLLSIQENIFSDSSLQSLQRDKKSQLTANTASLKSMTDAFHEGQKAVYQELAGVEGETEEPEEIKDEIENTGFSIKYAVLGFAGGFFVYCCAFFCWYFWNDRIKSTEEMKRLYTFPVYGGISMKNKAGTNTGGQMEAFERENAQLLNRLRLACKNQGLTKLCVASGFAFHAQEREYMQDIAGQLEKWGIHAVIAENAERDTALWDTLTETGNVLMVCRIGTTTHRMIDEAMNFYQENGIAVAGAMALI